MENRAHRSRKLLERIRQMTPKEASAFATPAEDLIVLPFPSAYDTLPRERFSIGENEDWNYVQRAKSKELLDGVHELITTPCAGLWLFGTIGYGKSHLLAALVCYLVATGSRVLYLPDCRACLDNPFKYVQAAMLLCWAESPRLQMEVMALRTLGGISDFISRQFREDKPVIFVIDQMNALEPVPGDSEKNKERAALESWLMACSSSYKRVFGRSVNHVSHQKSLQKQMNILRVYAYGGLTEVRSVIC